MCGAQDGAQHNGWRRIAAMLSWPGHDTFRSGTLTDLAAQDLTAQDLATIYPKPTPRVIAKARPQIDAHAKNFIAMSPFCVLATSGSDASVDASPRGGNPGFVHVEGPNQLLMPDRSGNNRIDSFRNIVEGSGLLQLIFFVPGIDETLRVGGRGSLTTEPDLLATMMEFGKLPRVVLRIVGAGSLFPLWQSLDALAAVVAGHPRRARDIPKHRRSDPRPDQPRRAGAARCRGGALRDAA